MQLLEQGLKQISSRLPIEWTAKTVELDTFSETTPGMELRAPDGRKSLLAVKLKGSLQPREVYELQRKFGHSDSVCQFVVIAPYISPQVREDLTELGWGYIDLTGNIRVETSEPGLFIMTNGKDTNPFPEARNKRTLRGFKAGRIVRDLIDRKEPPKVRELAKAAKANPGYVSRVLGILDQKALVTRNKGRLVSVDWERLLRYWAEEAPLESRGKQVVCLEPRGLSTFQKRLKEVSIKYALTGGIVASHFAPVAPPRLATLYVDNADTAIQELGLRESDFGGNVVLIEAADPIVFSSVNEVEGLFFVGLSQVAADLLTSPGRGPAEGQELIRWMSEHEEFWRG